MLNIVSVEAYWLLWWANGTHWTPDKLQLNNSAKLGHSDRVQMWQNYSTAVGCLPQFFPCCGLSSTILSLLWVVFHNYFLAVGCLPQFFPCCGLSSTIISLLWVVFHNSFLAVGCLPQFFLFCGLSITILSLLWVVCYNSFLAVGCLPQFFPWCGLSVTILSFPKVVCLTALTLWMAFCSVVHVRRRFHTSPLRSFAT